MAKGRASSADKVLAAMVKDYRRLRRSLTEGRGNDPGLAPLMQRRKEVSEELRQLRRRIAALKKAPTRKLAPADSAALTALRESILMMSKNLGIPVSLD